VIPLPENEIDASSSSILHIFTPNFGLSKEIMKQIMPHLDQTNSSNSSSDENSNKNEYLIILILKNQINNLNTSLTVAV
jgi:hypothetical protein